MKRFLLISAILCFATTLLAEELPFKVSASLTTAGTNLLLSVDYSVKDKYHLYADMLSVDVPKNVDLAVKFIPPPVKKYDTLSEDTREMYTSNFRSEYLMNNVTSFPVRVVVNYQGCSETVCFMPVTEEFMLSPDTTTPAGKTAGPGVQVSDVSNSIIQTAKSEIGTSRSKQPASQEENNWQELVKNFTIAGDASGYLKSSEFINFIDKVENGQQSADASPADKFFNRGIWLSLILIVLGGVALNLTPCVLPMIPINVAIIGAGAQNGSKVKGFTLGLFFGLGIALVYGLLGVAVILTGSQFGAINASPWFNLIIALIFIVLALAMFDIITIDFTKYQQSAVGGRINKGTMFTAFFMGCIIALLAGACVAPVVIYVLLLSTSLYTKGVFIAIFLPFLLGFGMGLPWPFAGAGLSFLPKPGKWMARVKLVFGVFIILFAVYYGYIGYTLIYPPAIKAGKSHGWETSLVTALKKADKENKPVIIDFWASWCKNCTTMDKTTFKNKNVINKLEPYVKLKYQAERPNQMPEKQVLEYFNVIGLPTYVVIKPR